MGEHGLPGCRETGRQEERKMSDTLSNQGTAKSATPGAAAQEDVANSSKADWWYIGSLILIVTSVVGLAYTLWK
jgi:hypothetical protein